jgi:hypothetical protein
MERPDYAIQKLQKKIATEYEHRSFLFKRIYAIALYDYIEELEQELEDKK